MQCLPFSSVCVSEQTNAGIMMEDKRKVELVDQQLSDVTGGEMPTIIVQPVPFKRCAADPTHVYVALHDACPVCGTKEFSIG